MAKMKRVLYLVVVAAVIAGAVAWWLHSPAAPTEEGVAYLKSVQAEPFSELTFAVSPYCYSREKANPELVDYPADITDTSPDIHLYRVPIGTHQIFILFQDLPGGKTRAWVDTTLDNRLSDETAVSGIAKKYSESQNEVVNYDDFGTIQLSDGGDSPPAFNLVRIEKNAVRPTPICIHTGILRLGNQRFRLAVIDSNYNGTFDTFIPSEEFWPWEHDAIIVDSNTYGLLHRKHVDPFKVLPLGRYYKIEERYYSIAFSRDGKSVQMTPAEPEMGTLKIGNNIRFSAHLLSDAAAQSVHFRDQIPLPVGRYQMQWGSATMTFTGLDGVESQLRADFRNTLRKGLFEITEGQTTTLNPGPPFTIKTDIRKRSGHELSINASLVGNEGETYSLRIDRSAKRPELKILAENGDTLHTGSMEYG